MLLKYNSDPVVPLLKKGLRDPERINPYFLSPFCFYLPFFFLSFPSRLGTYSFPSYRQCFLPHIFSGLCRNITLVGAPRLTPTPPALPNSGSCFIFLHNSDHCLRAIYSYIVLLPPHEGSVFFTAASPTSRVVSAQQLISAQ